MKRLVALFPVLLCACVQPLSISGAAEPTPYTFELLESDITEAQDGACEQEWFTGEAEADLAEVDRILKAEGIGIVHRNPGGKAARSGRLAIYVDKEYRGKSPEAKALLMSHELVHQCDRVRLGDQRFEERYFHSAGRWVLEVRGYSQTVRSMVKQGRKDIERYIEKRVRELRDGYWLHDIDPKQYEAETRRILTEAADGDAR